MDPRALGDCDRIGDADPSPVAMTVCVLALVAFVSFSTSPSLAVFASTLTPVPTTSLPFACGPLVPAPEPLLETGAGFCWAIAVAPDAVGLGNALRLPLPVGEGLRHAAARSPSLIPRPLRLAVRTREEPDIADALLDATDPAEARLEAGDARGPPPAPPPPRTPGLAAVPPALAFWPESSGVGADALLRPLPIPPPGPGDG